MSKGPTDFLYMLHAMVESDPGLPGLKGKVAFGVKGIDRETWWQASFDHKANPSFVDARPGDADVSLLVGEYEANSLLDDGAFPKNPTLLRLTGDRKLLEKFVSRYVQPKQRGAYAGRSS